jgi:hypothetical protein
MNNWTKKADDRFQPQAPGFAGLSGTVEPTSGEKHHERNKSRTRRRSGGIPGTNRQAIRATDLNRSGG